MRKSLDALIREEMYNRFILALIRLKRINKKNDKGLAEVTEMMLGEPFTRPELICRVITDTTILVQLSIVTAVLEIATTWREFKTLWRRQEQGEDQLMIPDNDRYFEEFDFWLRALGKAQESFVN